MGVLVRARPLTRPVVVVQALATCAAAAVAVAVEEETEAMDTSLPSVLTVGGTRAAMATGLGAVRTGAAEVPVAMAAAATTAADLETPPLLVRP